MSTKPNYTPEQERILKLSLEEQAKQREDLELAKSAQKFIRIAHQLGASSSSRGRSKKDGKVMSFKLSEECQRQLNILTKEAGSTKTCMIELAVNEYYRLWEYDHKISLDEKYKDQ